MEYYIIFHNFIDIDDGECIDLRYFKSPIQNSDQLSALMYCGKWLNSRQEDLVLLCIL